MGTAIWAIFGNFWKQHYHWRIFDIDAGRTRNDRRVYLVMRFIIAIIQSALVLALFPVYYRYHRSRVSDCRTMLESTSMWKFNEASLSTTAQDFIAYELRQSIKESLKSSVQKGVYGYSHPMKNSADRFRNVWNALVGRSTTKPEDLHIVLANLLGFNAGYMMQKAPDHPQRMNASKFGSRPPCLATISRPI